MPVWLTVLIAALLLAGIMTFKKDALVNLGSTVNKAYISLSKNIIHAAVPKELQSNVYLDQKECGCCKSFTGDIAIAVVLVNDSVSQWDAESIAELQTMLDTGKADILADAAVYSAELSMEFYYYNAGLTGDLYITGNTDHWREDALKSAGLPPLHRVHNYLTEKYDAKEAPVIFAFNKPGRAYARNGIGEYLVLYSDYDTHTFQHELSHIFGAMDFYYPKDVKTYASEHLPDTIMNAGESVDALTAYLIGWTDVLADNAQAFLKDTKVVTAAYIRRENKKEVFTGNGTKEFETGTYTGDLVRGVCHGTGTMQYDDGSWYTGQWENGNWTGAGNGKTIFKDGGVYEGAYLNGKRHGQGTYTFPSGSVYTGQWTEGEMSGTGTIQYDSGNKYTGELLKGNITGTGTMYYADGSQYTGQWLDGKFHGEGTCIWASGSKYTGQWQESKMTGYGTYTKADGTVKTGMFEDGKFLG